MKAMNVRTCTDCSACLNEGNVMYANWRMSVIVWVVGFFTFLAGLNCINAAVIWGMNGISATVPLYVIGDVAPSLSPIPVTTYFWLSLASTFVLSGITIILALRRPIFGLEVQRMMSKVEDEMVSTRGALEATRISLFAKMEDEKIARKDLFTIFNANIENIKNEMLDNLEKERNASEKIRKDLEQITNEIGNLRKEVLGNSARQTRMIGAIERLSRRNVDSTEKNMKELSNLASRLGKLETELVAPRPKLTSESRPEELKGVGLRLAEEFKAIGITNVGELLLSDPKSIGARTRTTPEMAMRLQGRAQLLMIPSIDEIDAEMLIDAGISSKKELALQDAIGLYRRITRIAAKFLEEGKISELEKPTIEDISAWIKLAKL